MAASHKNQDLKDLCSKRALKYGQKADNYSSGLEFLAIETLAQDPQLVDSIVLDEVPSEMDLSLIHI